MTRHLRIVDEVDAARPRTRGDCEAIERPCPFVGCRYNNYLHVNGLNVKLTWPDLEPDEVDPEKSCALDVADRGGASLYDVGEIMRLTRERARQIEGDAVRKIKGERGSTLREFVDAPDEDAARATSTRSTRFSPAPPVVEEAEPEAEEPPVRVSFFAESESADEQVCDAVWTMFARDSNNRGISCRSANSIRVSKERAQRAHAWKTMPRRPDGTSAIVIAAYQRLSVALGREPKVREIQREPGLVGKTYNNIYMTMSNLRKKGRLVAPVVEPAPQPAVEEEPMARGEFSQTVYDTYQRLATELGCPPRATHIFTALGAEQAKSVANVNMALRRLRHAGRIPALEKPLKPGTVPRAPSTAMVIAKKAPPTAPSGSALDMLRVELEAAERRANALREAIDILERSVA